MRKWIGLVFLVFPHVVHAEEDLESLLAGFDPMVSPQGLLIIQRSTYTTTSSSSSSFGFLPSLPSLFFGEGEASSTWLVSRYDDTVVADDEPTEGGCPCGADVAALCEDDAPFASVSSYDDFGDLATVFDKRMCLARNGGLVSPTCGAHLSQSPTVVEYCYSDVETLCGNVRPGQNRVHDCLSESYGLLQPPCAAYVRSVEDDKSLVEDDDSYDLSDVVDAVLQTSLTLFQKLNFFFDDDDDQYEIVALQQEEQPYVVVEKPCDAEGKKKTVATEAPQQQQQQPREEEEEEAYVEIHEDNNVEEEEEVAVVPPEETAEDEPVLTLADIYEASVPDEAAESDPRPAEEEKPSVFAWYVAVAFYSLTLGLVVVSALTLASYACRKQKERRDMMEFKQKFAPLLVEI